MIELGREISGAWIAEIVAIPGVMVSAASKGEALREVLRLALSVVSDRLARGEDPLTRRS